jgi:hypothetical protein
VTAASVTALALRPARSARPATADSIRLTAGLGVAGDVHADPSSPRQLLLAGASVYEAFSLPPQALRENLLLDLDTACLASGTVLQIGGQVRLRMMFQCEACGQLDRVQPRLAQRLGNRRGMLARVLAGGTVHIGDPVVDLGALAPAWSDDWRERVRRVLDAMPPGCVVEYRDLARLAGIQSSYCRAMPSLLKRFGPPYEARAVSSQAAPGLPRWHGGGLFDQE